MSKIKKTRRKNGKERGRLWVAYLLFRTGGSLHCLPLLLIWIVCVYHYFQWFDITLRNGAACMTAGIIPDIV